jgi:hypothetical protein
MSARSMSRGTTCFIYWDKYIRPMDTATMKLVTLLLYSAFSIRLLNAVGLWHRERTNVRRTRDRPSRAQMMGHHRRLRKRKVPTPFPRAVGTLDMYRGSGVGLRFALVPTGETPGSSLSRSRYSWRNTSSYFRVFAHDSHPPFSHGLAL